MNHRVAESALSSSSPVRLKKARRRSVKVFKFRDRITNSTHRRVWSRQAYTPSKGWPVRSKAWDTILSQEFQVLHEPPQESLSGFQVKSTKLRQAMSSNQVFPKHFEDEWVGVPTVVFSEGIVEPEAVVQLRQQSPYSVRPPIVRLHKIPIPNRASPYSLEWIDEMQACIQEVNPTSHLVQPTIDTSTLYKDTRFETSMVSNQTAVVERGAMKSVSSLSRENITSSPLHHGNGDLCSPLNNTNTTSSSSNRRANSSSSWRVQRASAILNDSAYSYRRELEESSYYGIARSSHAFGRGPNSLKPTSRHYKLQYSWIRKTSLSPALSFRPENYKISPLDDDYPPETLTSLNNTKLVLSELLHPTTPTSTPAIDVSDAPYLLRSSSGHQTEFRNNSMMLDNAENQETWRFRPKSGMVEVSADYDPDGPFPHPFPWLPPCTS